MQEQPPFMVVAPDDDSLVFQFHKPQHHSQGRQTLTHPALLFCDRSSNCCRSGFVTPGFSRGRRHADAHQSPVIGCQSCATIRACSDVKRLRHTYPALTSFVGPTSPAEATGSTVEALMRAERGCIVQGQTSTSHLRLPSEQDFWRLGRKACCHPAALGTLSVMSASKQV